MSVQADAKIFYNAYNLINILSKISFSIHCIEMFSSGSPKKIGGKFISMKYFV